MPNTVLIIDDDRFFRAMMAPALEAYGFQVVEAGSGEEATRMLLTCSPECVVIDGLLPDTSGIRWLEQHYRRLARVRKVFTSSFWKDLASHQRLHAELGVSLIITKPFAPSEFGEQVAMMMRQGDLADALPRYVAPTIRHGANLKRNTGTEAPLEPNPTP